MADHCAKVADVLSRAMLQKSCPHNSRCSNRWKGRVCECPHAVHTKKECATSEDTLQFRILSESASGAVSLMDEESFVVFSVLEEPLRPPLRVSLEFRSRRLNTQILAMEFSKRSHFFVLSVCPSFPRGISDGRR